MIYEPALAHIVFFEFGSLAIYSSPAACSLLERNHAYYKHLCVRKGLSSPKRTEGCYKTYMEDYIGCEYCGYQVCSRYTVGTFISASIETFASGHRYLSLTGNRASVPVFILVQ